MNYLFLGLERSFGLSQEWEGTKFFRIGASFSFEISNLVYGFFTFEAGFCFHEMMQSTFTLCVKGKPCYRVVCSFR